MPSSLAKKSMNFLRDVYEAASSTDRPQLLQPQVFQPTAGLSNQFIQPGVQYPQSPASPHLQSIPPQGQYQPVQGFQQQQQYYPAYPGHLQAPSYDAWSAPSPAQGRPPTSSPTGSFGSPTNTNYAYGVVSPVSPPSPYPPYGFQQPMNFQQQYAHQRPPLPPRQPSQPWHSTGSQPTTTPANASPGSSYAAPPPSYSAPPTLPANHSNFNGFQPVAELPAHQHVPPRLPQRPATQSPHPGAPHELANVPSVQVQPSRAFASNNPSGPTTTYHELSGEPSLNVNVYRKQTVDRPVRKLPPAPVELPAVHQPSVSPPLSSGEPQQTATATPTTISAATPASSASPQIAPSASALSSASSGPAATPTSSVIQSPAVTHHDPRPAMNSTAGFSTSVPQSSPTPSAQPLAQSNALDMHSMNAALNDIRTASPSVSSPAITVSQASQSPYSVLYPTAVVPVEGPSHDAAMAMYAQMTQSQTVWNSGSGQLVPVTSTQGTTTYNALQTHNASQAPQIYQGTSQWTNTPPQSQFARPDPPQSQSGFDPQADVLRVHHHSNEQNSRVRKILCLDGGGVRGLSELIIIDYLMDMLSDVRGARLEPWQEFDMIAGTSTGGLIALMLGRLRMSVSDCIKAYKEMSKEIFTPNHRTGNFASKSVDFLQGRGRFKSEPLEKSVKQMLTSLGLSEDELLSDRNPDSPAVFVCAVEGINSDAVVIRSYRSKEFDDLKDCRIWEAARATSAASTFFDPIKIGDRLYVDGALKHNNPIEKVDEESRGLWPDQERIIVSIGTGSAPGPDVTGDLKSLVDALKKIVTETEDTSNAFRKRNRRMVDEGYLYRFNVFHGLAEVGLAEHEAVGKISAHTATYLRRFDTAADIERCAKSLCDNGQRLGYIAGEGIPYSDGLFMCPECGMIICKDCHRVHDEHHMRKILRFRTMQYLPTLPGVPVGGSCWHCAEDSPKSRWQCDKCEASLCRRCAGNFERRDAFLKAHATEHPEHRSFLALYPPYWTMTTKWVTDHCPCTEVPPGAALGVHCERCHDVVQAGARTYNCRSCTAEFGSTQVICTNCYAREDPTHLSTHQWMTTDFILTSNSSVDTLAKGTKISFHCPLCPGQG
ncbi:hypothetical protein H2204_000266 [Knufia peltigerae]|uniref:PNPLA domain-containing protein n=1 Tax=Knufia peltigerae TaxID=1002370 RepID=A0AA38YG78_9EURO|nr:hypothetical protein H2204_000266 [Knufia peltigerae]